MCSSSANSVNSLSETAPALMMRSSRLFISCLAQVFESSASAEKDATHCLAAVRSRTLDRIVARDHAVRAQRQRVRQFARMLLLRVEGHPSPTARQGPDAETAGLR